MRHSKAIMWGQPPAASEQSVGIRLSDMRCLGIRVRQSRSFALGSTFLLSKLDLLHLTFSLMLPPNQSTGYAILFSLVFSCLPYCYLIFFPTADICTEPIGWVEWSPVMFSFWETVLVKRELYNAMTLLTALPRKRSHNTTTFWSLPKWIVVGPER